MTDTFTLTGRILDKGKNPVVKAKLVLSGSIKVLRDPDADEVYAPTPRVTTDADGYLCVADGKGIPADTPGVPLVVGVQYRLRAVNPGLLDPLVFSDAQAVDGTLNIARVEPENPTPDTAWTTALGDLTTRVQTLEDTPAVTSWDDLTDKPTIPATAADVGALPDDYTPAWSEVTGKPTTFPPASHQHPTSDVTGLDAALATKANQADLDATNTAVANKVNSSTYTAGLAGKADLVSGAVPDGQLPTRLSSASLSAAYARRDTGGKIEGSKNGLKYDGTDETAAMQAILDAAANFGARVIELEGLVRCDGQLRTKTSIVGTQLRQAPLRITGTVQHMPGSAMNSLQYPSAPGLDLRYAGRTDAGCVTTLGSAIIDNPAAVAADRGKIVTGPGVPDWCWILAVTPGVGWTVSKAARATGTATLTSFGGRFESYGYGTLEIDHLQFISGAATSAPFGLSTATTIRLHDNLFQGSNPKTGVTCDEDPWVFGGIGQGTALTSALASGTAYTTLAVSAVPVGIPSGSALVINTGAGTTQTVTTSAAVTAGATSIPVTSFTANASYPARTSVFIGDKQSQTDATSWDVPSALFQGYLSEVEDNHFHRIRRIAIGGFATDIHISKNSWMHNCGSNLAAKPSTLTTGLTSGSTYTSLAVTALNKPILAGDTVQIGVGDGAGTSQEVTASADAAAGATSISVTSFIAAATFNTGTKVYNTTAGLGAMIESFASGGSANAVTAFGNRFGYSGAYNYATRFQGVTINSVLDANNNQDTSISGYAIASHRFDRGAEYNTVRTGLTQTIPPVDDWGKVDGSARQTVISGSQSRASRFPQGIESAGSLSRFIDANLPTIYNLTNGDSWRAVLGTDSWTLRASTAANGNRDLLWVRIAGGAGFTDLPAVTNSDSTVRNNQGHLRLLAKSAFRIYLGDAGTPSNVWVTSGRLTADAVIVKSYATGSRPAASTVGAGGHVFDSTLNKPIWSDGTNWRDAAGTVV